MHCKKAVAIHSTRYVCVEHSKLNRESVNTGIGAVILITPTAISKHVFQLIKK